MGQNTDDMKREAGIMEQKVLNGFRRQKGRPTVKVWKGTTNIKDTENAYGNPALQKLPEKHTYTHTQGV